MKTSFSLFLAISMTVTGALAGSFGGPGPFRNGSPLPTGTDGTYNASFQGANLSGIFRFSINSGTQQGDVVLPNMSLINPPGLLDPAVPTQGSDNQGFFMPIYSSRNNVWVAWYEGIAYRGLTDAAIIEGEVSGVLDTMKRPQAQMEQPTSGVSGSNVVEFSNGIGNQVGQSPVILTGEDFRAWLRVFRSDPTSSNQEGTSSPSGPIRNTLNNPGPFKFTRQTTVSATQGVLPIEFQNAIATTLQGGEFQGSLDQKSPYGAIKGNGLFIAVVNNGLTDGNLNSKNPDNQLVVSEIAFKFKGARVFSGNPNISFSTQ